MREFCLTCYKLKLTSTYQEEGHAPTYGYCDEYKIYKYSPYHNCSKAVQSTHHENYSKWARNKARGMNTFADKIDEYIQSLESTVRDKDD